MPDFTHFLDIEEAPARGVELDPGIYVEPKDRLTASETQRQAAWVKFMRAHVRQCLVFAVPNGTNINSRLGRAKVKREGLHTGFPDNGVLWADGSAFPEWKSGRGDPSEAQIETLNWMHRRNIPVAIVRTSEGCLAWLRSIGAPVPHLVSKSREA